MVYISHHWRYPRLILVLMVLELVFSIPALALFAIASPDQYRTSLWQDGYNNGFNSSPAQILYAYANYTPVSYPLVWNPWITEYNVVISVLSTFVLLVKAVCFVVHIWVPILSACVHLGFIGVWGFSVAAQSASDLSDPLHPQHGPPWYIAKSCSVAFNKSNIGYCRQAKSAFAVSVILLVLFIVNTVWAVYSMVPSKEQRQRRQIDRDEDTMLKASGGGMAQAGDGGWELREFPPPPTKSVRSPGMRASVMAAFSPKTSKPVYDGKDIKD